MTNDKQFEEWFENCPFRKEFVYGEDIDWFKDVFLSARKPLEEEIERLLVSNSVNILTVREDEKIMSSAEISRLKAEVKGITRTLVDPEEFCRFLEMEGYLDCDWYTEEPTILQRWRERNGK